MNAAPEVQPLPFKRRRVVFILSLLAFAIAVPTFVFYAVGYRFDFSNEIRNIRAVGGMYISAQVEDIAIYVDDEPVENMRIFQNAAYVQNLDAGLHQVHVQGNELQTWVKLLPVYAHFVTEASSFNVPARPQVRLIPEYLSATGAAIVTPAATATFAFASTTNTFELQRARATSSLEANPEYVYVSGLIASSTADRELLRQIELYERQPFRFTGKQPPATTSATTTRVFRNTRLYIEGGEVQAEWIGEGDRVPYYFCVSYRGPESTALGYGSHVMSDLITEYGTPTDFTDPELIGARLCRDTIRIDRKWQSVQYFDFVPGSESHVLLQLQDGVYVVEIDDRAWQNVQLLYPGDYLEVVAAGGQIFIKDGEYYLEVFTELQ